MCHTEKLKQNILKLNITVRILHIKLLTSSFTRLSFNSMMCTQVIMQRDFMEQHDNYDMGR